MAGGAGIGGAGISDPWASFGGIGGAMLTRVQPAFYLPFQDLGGGRVSVNPVTSESISATFTRAGATATTVGQDGLIIKAIPANVPRSYWDPSGGGYLGYLAEGARTNLCLQSEDFATTWINANTTESVNAITAPDGAVTADKINETTATGQHYMRQTFTKAASAITYTFSVWVKAAERSAIQLLAGNAALTSFSATQVDLIAGTINTPASSVGSFVGGACSIVTYPGGWYRCSMTFTTDTDTGLDCRVYLGESPSSFSYTGVATNGVYLWGAQLEAAAFASSYIPTTTAAVTRNADVLTYPTTEWLNASAGTVVVEWQTFAVDISHVQMSISDGTGDEKYQIGTNTAAGQGLRAFVLDGGVSQAAPTAGTAASNTTAISALAWEENNVAGAFNGTLSSVDTSATLPTVDILAIGKDESTNLNFGPIRRVAYWPKRLPNAFLQDITRG